MGVSRKARVGYDIITGKFKIIRDDNRYGRWHTIPDENDISSPPVFGNYAILGEVADGAQTVLPVTELLNGEELLDISDPSNPVFLDPGIYIITVNVSFGGTIPSLGEIHLVIGVSNGDGTDNSAAPSPPVLTSTIIASIVEGVQSLYIAVKNNCGDEDPRTFQGTVNIVKFS